ncbi:MAG: META domain-containing protein [Chlorobi bacterium]|nr:META domain-containing protein [Chlorobiota bacterium]
MKNTIFIIIITLSALSCSSAKIQKTKNTTQQSETMPINKTKWILISYKGQKPSEAGFKKRIPYLIIDEEKGQITGHSGCNSFNGQVNISGNKIKTGVLTSTKAYCMGVPEHEFFKLLNGTDNFKISADKLKLLKGNEVLLIFKAEK